MTVTKYLTATGIWTRDPSLAKWFRADTKRARSEFDRAVDQHRAMCGTTVHTRRAVTPAGRRSRHYWTITLEE